ncbi:hypothetical protein NDU88_008597 [Pleurodeles waltl]|uniref:Uncharacterized protein n=1 Tax=Pleurodeles waltl TaxID=8319 RepID=A0AAV7QSY2_PLEWA|nr:hypothetical protein NDU88_008597 [Pleurodeles waltl]
MRGAGARGRVAEIGTVFIGDEGMRRRWASYVRSSAKGHIHGSDRGPGLGLVAGPMVLEPGIQQIKQ